MAKVPVKFFHSSMAGAPTLGEKWGDLITVLDACLVDGFGLKSINSIARSAKIATVVVSAGHGYVPGSVVEISGADQADYNGEFRILTVATDRFTIAVPETLPASASTTTAMTCKIPGLGFERPFPGTSTKRVYRSPNPKSNRPYLRVDNGMGQPDWGVRSVFGRVSVSDSMTDIDTHSSNVMPFDATRPRASASSGGWYKWYHSALYNNYDFGVGTPPTGPRAWTLIGTDRAFYLMMGHNALTPETPLSRKALYGFGDFDSFKPGDGYNSFLLAQQNYLQSSDPITVTNAGNYHSYVSDGTFGGALPIAGTTQIPGLLLLKSHDTLGKSITFTAKTLGVVSGPMVMSGFANNGLSLPYPNPVDQSMMLHPVYIQQPDASVRGILPGYMAILNNLNDKTMPDNSIVEDLPGFTGQKFFMAISDYQNRDVVQCFKLNEDWFV